MINYNDIEQRTLAVNNECFFGEELPVFATLIFRKENNYERF